MSQPDDRRYMTFEERAKDDPRYRGKIEVRRDRNVCCPCGKTVIVDGFGSHTGQTCPRNCG